VKSYFVKRKQDFRTRKLLSHVPQLAYFILKTFAFKPAILEVVDAFYLTFTRDLMGNPLEKSLKLYEKFFWFTDGDVCCNFDRGEGESNDFI
jgi:hypothetical protein